MAKNKNERLKPRHTIYCAGTGGGKTTAIHNLGLIDSKSQVVIFDPYGTFERLLGCKVIQCHSIGEFTKKLIALRKSVKPFRLSLCGNTSEKVVKLYCRVLWEVSDGNQELECVFDELIRCIKSASKLPDEFAELMQGGRKYGLIVHTLFQRGQEVPKTIVNGSQRKWIGKQDSLKDARYWADEIDVNPKDIYDLNDLEYFLKLGGANSTVKGELVPLGSRRKSKLPVKAGKAILQA